MNRRLTMTITLNDAGEMSAEVDMPDAGFTGPESVLLFGRAIAALATSAKKIGEAAGMGDRFLLEILRHLPDHDRVVITDGKTSVLRVDRPTGQRER